MEHQIPAEELLGDRLAAVRGMAEARRQLAAQAKTGYERQFHERVLAEYERRLQRDI